MTVQSTRRQGSFLSQDGWLKKPGARSVLKTSQLRDWSRVEEGGMRWGGWWGGGGEEKGAEKNARGRAREAREGRMLLTCRSPRDLAGKTVSLNLTNWISMHQCWVLSLPPPSPTLGLAMSSGPFLSLSASNLISNTDFILPETGREAGGNQCYCTGAAFVAFAGRCYAIPQLKMAPFSFKATDRAFLQILINII